MKLKAICIALLLVANLAPFSYAQGEVVNNIRAAIKAGSARELGKYLNDTVEMSINGSKSSYNKTRAEIVLKDFFSKYPPENFTYIHQGSSSEGLRYAIGTYAYGKGTYRVYMLLKQFGGTYKIDTIDFSRD